MKIKYLLFLQFLFLANVDAQTIKILFDATKAESAGNADWVIDADQHNIYWNPNAQINSGDESNAQRFPVPLQSGILTSTPESYWQGGISNWGIDCVKQGYEVETLPYNGSITFNNTGNVQDLSNYKIFVVCEPNILFSTTEKNAILNFIHSGGSLFMISDHDQSDRNGDGSDSPTIWNDLMSANPFGITFNLNNFSQTSTSVITTLSDSIAYGSFGHVSQVLWSGGTDMTIDTAVNPTVRGVVFKNGSLNNNTKAMFAYARYGSGKVAAIGDSSPFDDGSGDVNDVLYNGYIQDAAGNHRKLIMNTTVWLATENNSTTLVEQTQSNDDVNVYSSNKNLFISNKSTSILTFKVTDLLGKIVCENSSLGKNSENIYSLRTLELGVYVVKIEGTNMALIKKIIISE